MSDPFVVAVGMVLQRNLKPWIASMAEHGIEDSSVGVHYRVVRLDGDLVFVEQLDGTHAGGTLWFTREEISAERFIPD